MSSGDLDAGETIDGGAGNDFLTLGAGAHDLTLAGTSIVNVETLRFTGNGASLLARGDHFGGAGDFTAIIGNAAITQALIVNGNSVNLSGLSFTGWGGASQTIAINGADALLNVLTGSGEKDTISGAGTSVDIMRGGGGADVLNGGGGGDFFVYGATDEAAAGEAINGGAGDDQINLTGAGSNNFSLATITSVEALDFLSSGAAIATFSGTQIGGAGAPIVNVSGGGGVDSLIVNAASDVSLAGVNFTSWTNGADTITINGTASGENLTGSSFNDIINGLGGIDTINAGAGNDTINGGAANDNLNGQGGDDTFVLTPSDGSDTIDGGADNDIVQAAAAAGSFSVFASGANALLAGATTTTTMSNVERLHLTSGTSNSNHFVDNLSGTALTGLITIIGGSIQDTVNAGNAINPFLISGGGGVDTITTGSGQDTIDGGEGNDTITSGGGADTLDGKGGADTLDGGAGNDTYIVDNAGDQIVETAGNGTNDQVFANVNFTLAAGVSIEVINTFGSGSTNAINLTGNEIGQTILGNAGVNTLDGKGGADQMRGFAGNDTYIVDNAGDQIFESVGNGTNDQVFANVNFTLAAGQNIEVINTFGSGSTNNINLTGNEIGQTILGNAGVNTLDGKGGADQMRGFAGNDTYIVDNAGDQIVEAAGNGTNDQVFANVNFTLAAGVSIEVINTFGSGTTNAINLTGNELVNMILGNAGANALNGGLANDTLRGFGGADLFLFNTAIAPAANIDTIVDFSVADDTIQLENAIFTGLAAGALAPGAFNTGAAATQADDRIIYNNATGALFFDSDGVGGAAQTQFATISGAPALTSLDFIVV